MGKDVLALLNSGSKVNAMTLAYLAHLGFTARVTNVVMQRIDKFSLAIYDMVIAAFQVVNKLGSFWFFQETFLLANISIKVILGMPFLTFSNADVQYAEKKLIWRIYTIKEALSTIRQIEIINRKKFAKAALDENVEAFVVHISSLRSKISIHSARKAQLTLLVTKEVTVPVEYSDFANVFLEKSANVFPERTSANEHAIELEEGKQPPYRPIYSLGPIELKTFKT